MDSNIRKFLRKVVPGTLRLMIRKKRVLKEHNKVAEICDALIDKYDQGRISHFPVNPKKEFADERIIWQYWGQGFGNAPEMVQICLKSVERYKGNYKLVRLTDENLSEYIDLPKEIQHKRSSFMTSHFSDLLRCALLTTYGGIWLDATLLLTGSLPEQYFTQDFFMFQRDSNEPLKKCWENNFTEYWGWADEFKVKVLNSLIYSKRGGKVITYMCDILYDLWVMNDNVPHYFFWQILFNELMAKHPELNCPVVSDCLPHYAAQTILDNFLSISFGDALKLSTIHKTSYKMKSSDIVKLKTLLKGTTGISY